MQKLSLLAFLISISIPAFTQKNKFLTDSLQRQVAHSKTDAEKVRWLGELASAYSAFDTARALQYSDEEMNLAEISRDRRSIMKALFDKKNVLLNISGGNQQHYDKAIGCAKKALEIAAESNDEEYKAWAYLALDDAYLQNDLMDKALESGLMAADLSNTIMNDSLKVTAHLSLADNYMSKSNKMPAFRNYLQAYNLAEESNSWHLKLSSYLSLGQFYGSIHQEEKEKDYYFKALALTRQVQSPYDEYYCLLGIGYIYKTQNNFLLGQRFFDSCLAIVNRLQFDLGKAQVYEAISELYLAQQDFDGYLKFLKIHPEIENAYTSPNGELDKIFFKASSLCRAKKFGSANEYFAQAVKLLAQHDMNSSFRKQLYWQYAGSLAQTGHLKEALEYYKKAEQLVDRNDLYVLKLTNIWYDSVYRKMGDYKMAYASKVKFDELKDSLDNLSKQDDLLNIEIDNETKQHQLLKTREEENIRLRNNLQYMGITISIVVIFILLIMMGMFSLSIRNIKALGFFAFLLLFEFIIMLIDNFIHDRTHGEPWKVLGIKLIIASVLLPLHHYSEEKAIQYLASRKKLNVKIDGKGLMNKLFSKKHKPAPHESSEK